MDVNLKLYLQMCLFICVEESRLFPSETFPLPVLGLLYVLFVNCDIDVGCDSGTDAAG